MKRRAFLSKTAKTALVAAAAPLWPVAAPLAATVYESSAYTFPPCHPTRKILIPIFFKRP